MCFKDFLVTTLTILKILYLFTIRRLIVVSIDSLFLFWTPHFHTKAGRDSTDDIQNQSTDFVTALSILEAVLAALLTVCHHLHPHHFEEVLLVGVVVSMGHARRNR